jgi:hypothetical protein
VPARATASLHPSSAFAPRASRGRAHLPQPHAPQDASTFPPRHRQAAGRVDVYPSVRPRVFPVHAPTESSPYLGHVSVGPLVTKQASLHPFKAALLPLARASALSYPHSAVGARATPWPSCPLARVRHHTATLNPPLGPAGARTTALCPALSPPSPNFKPPPGSAAQPHRRRLRPD